MMKLESEKKNVAFKANMVQLFCLRSSFVQSAADTDKMWGLKFLQLFSTKNQQL